MNKIFTHYLRSKTIESSHKVKCKLVDGNGKTIFSTQNDNDLIYPRSSIKIFQAIPFLLSKSLTKYNLNSKHIALACSSQRGESFHLKELRYWKKIIGINYKDLKCGLHLPLNKKAEKKFIESKESLNQLYNNCAGKHLGMITGCLSKNYPIDNYLSFNHPYQIEIRKIFNKFTESKITRINYGVDGCSAPQYSFKIKHISKALNNLIKSYNKKFHYNKEVKLLINSILKNPKYIGGSDSLDSKIMQITNKKIFCKGGAEGVFLFGQLEKGTTGVLKVEDGNERALGPVLLYLLSKYEIINQNEIKMINKFINLELINHAKVKVGDIKIELR